MSYFGSKATPGLCQALISLMPPHSVYIESHLGGGALMKRKPASLRSIGIDLDERALAAFEGEDVELVHGCAHGFLSSFEFLGDELVYSDPPYLHATRRSSRRYRFDYDEADHVALLELLKGLPCQVMISGHPSPLYDDLLSGWRRIALQVMTHGKVRTEVVWFNFAPVRMHWARCAGSRLHASSVGQAQGGQLGASLWVAVVGRAACGSGCDHGLSRPRRMCDGVARGGTGVPRRVL